MSQKIVVSYGGGVDSTAMLAYLYATGQKPDLIVMSDTGAEMPHTLSFVSDHMQPWLASIGWPPIHITRWIRQDGSWIPLDDDCLNKSQMPSKAYGMAGCTSKYKQQPLDKYVRQWAALHGIPRTNIVRLVGYDANEGRRLEKLLRGQEPGSWTWRAPLYEAGLDREGCKVLIRETGLPIPLKSSCYMCPMLHPHEILAVNALYPDLMAKALIMEELAVTQTVTDPALQRRGLGLRNHKRWKSYFDGSIAADALPIEEALEGEPDEEMPCGCTD